MRKLSLLVCTLVSGLLGIGGLAHAATHRINMEPVRATLNALISARGDSLKLGRVVGDAKNGLTKPITGISAAAAEKARQGLVGFLSFNSGNKGSLYASQMGKAKIIVAAVKGTDYTKGKANKVQRFEVRSSQQGLILARGYVDGGKITWTRSHNEHAKSTPAEINDAE